MRRACGTVIASEAKQSRAAHAERTGLLRRFAPRNDGAVRMRRSLALLLIAALATPALAQDQPKTLKTLRIHQPPPGASTLYAIDQDGTVRIDWPAVETLAATKTNRTVLPMALMMLAIRDRTWKAAR
jgi:hypothetical protein